MANPRAEIPIVVLANESPTSPVAGATAIVKNRIGGTEATVFADSGTTNNVITQPLSTDSTGKLTGWLSRGAYEVQITIPGQTPYTEHLDVSPAADGGVDSAWLAANSVTTEKINALSVTTAKLGEASVTATKLATNAVTGEKIIAEAVTSTKIGPEAVTAAKVANLGVTTGKLAELSVTSIKIAASAVEEAKVKDAAITSRKVKITEGEAFFNGSEIWLPFGGGGAIIASRTINCAVASVIHVRGEVHCGQRPGNPDADQVLADLLLDGTPQGRGGIFGFEESLAVPGIARTSIALGGRFVVASGNHTFELRVSCTNGSSAAFGPSGFMYTVFSQ